MNDLQQRPGIYSRRLRCCQLLDSISLPPTGALLTLNGPDRHH